MQSWFLRHQCYYALSRDQFLFNDLYDKQIDNCGWGHCDLTILLYAFVINRAINLHIFLTQLRSLKERGYGGSLHTQRHHCRIHWPTDVGHYQLQKLIHLFIKKPKWAVDPIHTSSSGTWWLSPLPQPQNFGLNILNIFSIKQNICIHWDKEMT